MLELAVLEIAVYHPYISHFVVVVLLCFICYHLPSVPSSNLVSSPQQETPLHWAATGGHKDIVKYIIQAGADVNIKDNRGVRL